jgi:hypothetical protein
VVHCSAGQRLNLIATLTSRDDTHAGHLDAARELIDG